MRQRLLAFGLALLIGLALLTTLRLPPLRPLETVLFAGLSALEMVSAPPIRALAAFFTVIGRVSDLYQENQRLRQEVAQLRGDLARLAELERENRWLREQLGLRQTHPDFRWISARVIGYDPSNVARSVVIDRGSRDQVAEGMTVFTPAGLVGRVVQVSPLSAKVLLITDPASAVNGVLQSSRARGVVQGSPDPLQNRLVMRYIGQEEKIATGELVLTSGLGGVFPAGLPIGRVVAVRQQDTALFQEALIEPLVDLQRLEEVLVLTSYLPLRLE